MPKLSQVSLGGGEISPSLFARTDLQKYASALRTCRNFFVRPTGGASNRAGLQFVYELNADSLAALVPFIFSVSQSYMLVFQDESVQVYSDGAYVANTVSFNIANIAILPIFPYTPITVTTSAPHGLSVDQTVMIADVVATGSFKLNGTFTVRSVSTSTTFTISRLSFAPTGSYTSGGTVTANVQLVTPYQSIDLADLRYAQSADVLTVVNQGYPPRELVRTGVTTFTFDAIADFTGGPFLDDNTTAVTMKSSAATGVVTITASSSVFRPEHVGGLVRLTMKDFSAIPPWEPNKLLAASGIDPDGLLRRSNGKVYVVTGEAVGAGDGVFTGTAPPSHSEGIQADGDGSAPAGSSAGTRAGVKWQYLHSYFGTARITAQAGTTATATVLDYMPVVNPATTTAWALGALSDDQGYPALVTYYQDRFVLANTPAKPQTQWASKTADYHNFNKSSPLVANDAITQTLNARQINAIVEMIPMDQLISLTASGSWASPKRGETWQPTTIGFDPQSFDGAAFLRAIVTGDNAIFVEAGQTRIRDLGYTNTRDKFGGEELTIFARHLFDAAGLRIVDMDYAKNPHGILWVVREDGALTGLTYLKEQEVIGWHRHDTQGFFERVCVIPENSVDVPYFVVRREINGVTKRFLERMAYRDVLDPLEGFFVDCGLTYDGRNTGVTTIQLSGASYAGGATVTLTASTSLFAATDVGDAIQFPLDGVRALISAYTSPTVVQAVLQSPVPVALQNFPTVTWTFARDTFSGLDHLEGETVAITADGLPEVPQVVNEGKIILAYPAGVVHIGLPYIGELETLDVTIFGAAESVRDNAKRIPSVGITVERTLGLKAGTDAEHLYEAGTQPTDFDFNQPWALQSDVYVTALAGSWDSSGRVLIRQDRPLPATVLAIHPRVEIGEPG